MIAYQCSLYYQVPVPKYGTLKLQDCLPIKNNFYAQAAIFILVTVTVLNGEELRNS